MKLKSPPLLDGSRIGVIAPASPVKQAGLIEKVAEQLISWGYQVVLGKTAVARGGYLAGDDQLRQADLESMWLDRSISAIWCLRGGYGCLRLLSALNYRCFEKDPKILIGFSDITALEMAFWSRIRLVTFHGPVLTSINNDFSKQCAFDMLTGVKQRSELEWPHYKRDQLIVIHSGKAQGILLGGNLATISSMAGTGYLPDMNGSILFIEEVREAAYRVDRLLTQLLISGFMDGVKAVLIGKSIPVANETEQDLVTVFAERLAVLKCPVAYGFPIGHFGEQWTIPQGIKAEVDLKNGAVYLLESPFVLT